MSAPLKLLFGLVLLAAFAGLAFAVWAILGIRGDLDALSARVARVEQRLATQEPPTSREAFSIPSGGPPAATPLPLPSETEALRRQVAELAARVQALSGGTPAAPPVARTDPRAASAVPLPPPAGPTFDETTREAIKALVRETLTQDNALTVKSLTFAAPVMNDIETLGKELGLSETQKTEIEKVWAEREKEMMAIWQGTADPQQMEKMVKEMNRKFDERIKQLLTVEQARKYEDLTPKEDALFFDIKTRQALPPHK